MKAKPIFQSFLTIAVAAFLNNGNTQADILYWDGGDSGANAQGGSGTWDNSTTNWDTAATAGSDIDWDDSDFAIFGTPAGTVTLGAPITTNGMQFNVHSYTITADTTNTLTFASGNNTISTNFTSALGNVTNINGTVQGTDANLLFTAINPASNPVGHIISFGGASGGGWTGTTTIDKNMVVRLQDTNQALLNTSSITLRGGTLLLTNTDTQNTLNRVKDDAIINSYGGNIRTNNTLAAVAYTETMGELKLHGGNTTLIQWINQNSGGSQVLSFNGITREASSFATMNVGSSFGTTNLIRNSAVSAATTAGEIIGPWMIAGNGTSQSEYTRYDSSGNIVQVVRNGANTITAESSLTSAWASTANWYYNGSVTLTANRVMNTLRTSNNAVYQLGDYSLATNGLLAGGGNLTISVPTGTGYFTAAGNAGGDNAIYINSANGFIILGAPVKDNGNPVTMVLTTGTNGGRIDLNAANTHTGGTVISAPSFRNGAEGQTTAAGSVNLGNANGLGSNTTHLRMDSGTLNTNAIAATVGKFQGFTSAYLTGTAGTVFTVGNGTAANVTGDFAGTIHNVRLTKVGDGTQILSGTNVANNTTAQYTVNGGTLQFAKTSALMNSVVTDWTAAKIVVGNGGTLAFNVGGEGEFTSGNVTTLLTNLGGTNGTSTTGFAAGSRIGFDTTNAGGTFTINNNMTDSTGTGGGAIGLTKLGTGTLTLSGTNTYTGATTVTGGKLAINGSITSAVTVQTGATLQGSGSITGNVSIQSGGSLATGNSIESLTITGNLTQESGSTFAYEMNKDAAAGVAGDLTAVSGNLTLTGSTLTLTELGSGTWGVGEKLTLLSYTGTLTGLFTYNSATLTDDSTFDFSGVTWQFNYNDIAAGTNYTGDHFASSSYVTMTVIPEPKAALLGALGVLLLLRRRR